MPIAGNPILFRPHSAELEPDYLRGQIRDFKIDSVLVSRLVQVCETNAETVIQIR
jgi:hypothetical protein